MSNTTKEGNNMARKLTVIRGKGTKREKRIPTNITVYPVRRKGRTLWVTIPKE